MHFIAPLPPVGSELGNDEGWGGLPPPSPSYRGQSLPPPLEFAKVTLQQIDLKTNELVVSLEKFDAMAT